MKSVTTSFERLLVAAAALALFGGVTGCPSNPTERYMKAIGERLGAEEIGSLKSVTDPWQYKNEGEPVYPVTVTGSDPMLGPEDAPVTIVVFSDFECPFCGKYAATLKDVKEKYGALVRVVFKQFPLPFHENAFGKALVTFAAQKYGQFWYMHDLIFGLGPDLTEAQFKEKLGEWGTDLDSFMTLAQSQELIDRVDADMAQAQELGVNGTPYSFVNGVLLSGAQPPEPVEAAVEAALGRAYVLLAQGVKPEDVYSKLIESGK